MELLSLRGRAALSPFRVAKLREGLAGVAPSHRITSLAATWWHFVEVTRPLAADERTTLERLLSYGPQDTAGQHAGATLVVVPRPGTISPWSSKATDIAHNCGLAALNARAGGRFPRRYGAWRARRKPIARRAPRSTTGGETVFNDLREFRAVLVSAPRPIASIHCSGRTCGARGANTERGLALVPTRSRSRGGFKALRETRRCRALMFAQENSEHCRHKFQPEWIATGPAKEKSLFAMISEIMPLRRKHDRCLSTTPRVMAQPLRASFGPDGRSPRSRGQHRY